MEIETRIGNLSTSDFNGRAARTPDSRDGVIGSVLALSLGMLESVVRTSGNVGRTLASEGQKLTESVIELNEQGSQALLRVARKVSESSFGLITDGCTSAEQAALVVLMHGQRTSDRVAELVAHASHAAVGSRGHHEGEVRA